MDIVVNEELKAYIDPMAPEEYEALERSILDEGCRDALILWGDVLVDGHNRYGICRKHGLPFKTVQNPRFRSIEDVQLWMIDQHLGRRSLSDYQRGVLALRKKEIVGERRSRAAAAPAPDAADPSDGSDASNASASEALAAIGADAAPLDSREAVARAARLSSSQVVMIEKIQKQAAPELVQAVRDGTISINAAAAVSSLPADEQVAAVAKGKDELKQAAKRVRESKRKPRDEAEGAKAAEAAHDDAAPGGDELQTLRRRVAELTAENESLRRQLAALQAGSAESELPAPF
ncbi:plasmid replication/partition related protein [Variovorax sp. KK3]|uniref:plasmid replication/partition related protein n=1 Tax=Variovorax sp. KK3 TaxID=1855728 RepID=UPI00097CB4F0|nr:plasmid replication/partition related protein [Variovorax sp. KK3]